MAKKEVLGTFDAIEGLEKLYTARRGRLRGVAFVLRDKSVCIVNPPKGLQTDTIESLNALGVVSHLVAPNHYHHLGVAEYSQEFKKAKRYGTVDAIPRLNKVTGLKFSPVEKLHALLPKGFSFLTTSGLKTGELWLRVANKKVLAWVVVDAFCGPDTPDHEEKNNAAQFISVFPRFGIKDVEIYRAWLLDTIAADKPTMVIPCHGGLLGGRSLPKQLIKIAKTAF